MHFCIRESKYGVQPLLIVLLVYLNVAVIMRIISLISFKRGPRAKEANHLKFTIQRPGDLIYIPSLRPHAILTLDTGKPTILSGWNASTITDTTIITKTLAEYNVGVRRGTWRKILLTQGREALRNRYFQKHMCIFGKKS